MIDGILEVLRKLTRLELVVAAGMLGLPAALQIIGLAALAANAPLAGLLVVVSVLGLLAVGAGVALYRRLRLRRALRMGQLAAEAAVDHRQEWIDPLSIDKESGDVLRAATARSRRVLHLFGVRTGSRWVRDVYAAVLTRGRLDAAGLAAALVDDERTAGSAPVLAGLPDAHLVGYGRMLVGQDAPGEGDEVRRAIQTRLLPGWADLAIENQEFLAEWLIATDRRAEAGPIVESWRGESLRSRLLAADLANPHTGGPGSEEAWLAAVNTIFRPYDLDPISLAAGTGPVFDRIETTARDRVHGPLISVVMSSYLPDRALITAVRSIARQTWEDWELIVIDDASPTEYGDVLDEAAAMDDRVRVVRAKANAGTYVRRNEAIATARGEFVTMHDSDDWAHPRRLEVQARQLIASPDLAANLSTSLRVTEDLAFVQPRRTALRPAESSILFRRQRVVDRIGYYDAVRRGADSEYRLRLEAAFRQPAPVLATGGPLALIRYTATSLSGSDFGDGSMHPGRVSYRSAMDYWHAAIRQGRADPLVPHPMGVRPFPASAHVLGSRPEVRTADVVVVLDVRPHASPKGFLEAVTAELTTFVDAGGTAMIAHVDSLVEDRRLGIAAQALQQLVNSGRVTRVDLRERVDAGVVVVRSASVLQGLPATPTSIRSARTVVVEAAARDVRGVTYARADVEATASAMFGGEPEWRTARDKFTLVELTP